MHAETGTSGSVSDAARRRRWIATVLFWAWAIVLLLAISIGLAFMFGRGIPANVPTHTITAAQAGTEVALQVGERLAVTLEGNPTTGYTWMVVTADPALLTQLGEPEFQPASDALGAGGMQTLRFAAIGAGTTPLKLSYVRPFEPNAPPLATFEVQVRVSAP